MNRPRAIPITNSGASRWYSRLESRKEESVVDNPNKNAVIDDDDDSVTVWELPRKKLFDDKKDHQGGEGDDDDESTQMRSISLLDDTDEDDDNGGDDQSQHQQQSALLAKVGGNCGNNRDSISHSTSSQHVDKNTCASPPSNDHDDRSDSKNKGNSNKFASPPSKKKNKKGSVPSPATQTLQILSQNMDDLRYDDEDNNSSSKNNKKNSSKKKRGSIAASARSARKNSKKKIASTKITKKKSSKLATIAPATTNTAPAEATKQPIVTPLKKSLPSAPSPPPAKFETVYTPIAPRHSIIQQQEQQEQSQVVLQPFCAKDWDLHRVCLQQPGPLGMTISNMPFPFKSSATATTQSSYCKVTAILEHSYAYQQGVRYNDWIAWGAGQDQNRMATYDQIDRFRNERPLVIICMRLKVLSILLGGGIETSSPQPDDKTIQQPQQQQLQNNVRQIDGSRVGNSGDDTSPSTSGNNDIININTNDGARHQSSAAEKAPRPTPAQNEKKQPMSADNIAKPATTIKMTTMHIQDDDDNNYNQQDYDEMQDTQPHQSQIVDIERSVQTKSTTANVIGEVQTMPYSKRLRQASKTPIPARPKTRTGSTILNSQAGANGSNGNSAKGAATIRKRSRPAPKSSTLIERLVPFCRVCQHKYFAKKASPKCKNHHAWCPLNPSFDQSGAKLILERIEQGRDDHACLTCLQEYESGKPAHKVRHNKDCIQNQQRLQRFHKKREWSDGENGEDGNEVGKGSDRKLGKASAGRNKATKSALQTQKQNNSTKSLQTKRRRLHLSQTAAGSDASDDSEVMHDDDGSKDGDGEDEDVSIYRPKAKKGAIQTLRLSSATNKIGGRSRAVPTEQTRRTKPQSDVNLPSTSPKGNDRLKSRWMPFEDDPWGPLGHQDGDIVIYDSTVGLGHHETLFDAAQRFNSNPFGSESEYIETHFTPAEGFDVLVFERDKRAMRPWGFSVQRHEFGHACLVVTVDPISSASSASYLAAAGSNSCNTALRVHDMILAVNGKQVGHMTEVGLALEFDTACSTMTLVVSRYKYADEDRHERLRREKRKLRALDAASSDKQAVDWVEVGSGSQSRKTSSKSKNNSQSNNITTTDIMKRAKHDAEIDAAALNQDDIDIAQDCEQSNGNDISAFADGKRRADKWASDENAWLGCVCGVEHNKSHELFWIQCDSCQSWYEVGKLCVGFDQKQAESMTVWSCPGCADENTTSAPSLVDNGKNKIETDADEAPRLLDDGHGDTTDIKIEDDSNGASGDDTDGGNLPGSAGEKKEIHAIAESHEKEVVSDGGCVETKKETDAPIGNLNVVDVPPHDLPDVEEIKFDTITVAKEQDNIQDDSVPSLTEMPVSQDRAAGNSVSKMTPPLFAKGDLVMVKKHSWAGTNVIGGIGHVKAVRADNYGDIVHDIKYVVGSMASNIEAAYIEPYSFPSTSTRKESRRKRHNRQ